MSNTVDETRRIWVFSVTMDVIKCVKNNFCDKTKVLSNDEIINHIFIGEFINNSPEFAGLKVCHKLTSSHLNPTSFQRISSAVIQ